MPLQVGNLTSLRMLGKFIVGEGGNGLKISELKKFSQLEGKLQIAGLQNVVDIRDTNFINLKEKPKLLELDLEWIKGSLDSRNSDREEQVLTSLEPCPNLSRLSIVCFGGKEFPLWIGDPIFSNLVELKLVNCSNITSLPPLGQLPLLKDSSIEGMSGVEEVGSEFYEDDSSFSSLETLNIGDMPRWEQWWWCNGLSEDSVAKFPKLRKLRIQSCRELVGNLPSFLPSLEELEIVDCPKLVESSKVLPSLIQVSIGGWSYGCQEAVLRNLCQVPCLAQLKLRGISSLVKLDKTHMHALLGLQDLEISCCDELKYLWVDGTILDYLTSLKRLYISSCSRLVSLVDGEEGFLPCNLESLKIDCCYNLEELPNGLHNLKSLKDLRVSSCKKLFSLPDRGLPYSLKQLVIQRCPSLEVLYSNEMAHLESFHVYNCRFVSCCPNSKFPDSLKTLSIHKGTKQCMESLYYGFSMLTHLELSDCNELELFPVRQFRIPTLVSLTISNCKKLKSLSNYMRSFHRLQCLEVGYCDEFDGFPERGLPIPCLVSLQIIECRNLKSLPNRLPPKLTELKISDCDNLSQPMAEWGLHRLTSVWNLRIGDIRSTRDIVSFPDDKGLLLPTSLTHLTISGFQNLESISGGILKLTSLRDLNIDECPELRSFPDEGLNPTLENLTISYCPLLKKRCRKDKGDYWPMISHIPCIQLIPRTVSSLFTSICSSHVKSG